jgi:hypothetical protein
MKYSDLDQRYKRFLNGKLSQYMDAYIRQHKVWTPEQMHTDFYLMIEDEISRSIYTISFKDGIVDWTSEYPTNWLMSDEGKKLALEKFTKKYEKDRPIADRKSPIVERVRFGFRWESAKYYDLNFGLKSGYNYIETKELENLKLIPWSVEHVNKQLEETYSCDLIHCLNTLSTSYLEKKFAQHWISNYYSSNNPALLPEVCALRPQFYYYVYNGGFYGTIEELPVNYAQNRSLISSVNYRYDFLIANFKRQKIAFIELDGFEHHKSREQQTIDSIKRNNASSNGIALLTFTSKRINDDIDAVFKDLDIFLK